MPYIRCARPRGRTGVSGNRENVREKVKGNAQIWLQAGMGRVAFRMKAVV